ncbi:hypothetical protein GCM10017711_37950 [Paeniglutamicibacter sulfureus]
MLRGSAPLKLQAQSATATRGIAKLNAMLRMCVALPVPGAAGGVAGTSPWIFGS